MEIHINYYIYFLVISNPVTYVFVNNTIGKLINIQVSDILVSNNCWNVVHAAIFTLILRIIMG